MLEHPSNPSYEPLPLPARGNKDKDYLERYNALRHMAGDVALLESAQDLVDEMLFFRPYPHLQAVYNLMVEYKAGEGHLPNMATYDVELASYLQSFGIHELHQKDMRELVLKGLSAHPMEINNADVHLVVIEEYRDYLYGQYTSTMQNGFHNVEDMTEFGEEMLRKLTHNPFKAAKVTSFAHSFESDLADVARTAMGVPFMDEMLDGGPAAGELIGFLAPSGGGKSTLGWMAASACIMSKRDIWYVSTEQRMKGDFQMRSMSLLTGQSRNIFKHGWDSVPANIKDLCKERVEEYDVYSHFIDATDTEYRSIDAVFEPVRRKIAQGQHPGLIIVDWWGRLSDQINLNNPAIKTDPQKRMHDRDNLHRLKKLAEEFRCPILVLHQLSGAANGKSSNTKLTAADAQENKSFNNMFDFCFVAGNRNSDDVLDINTDKARSIARCTRKQKLNGEFCKFEDVTDYDSVHDAHTLEAPGKPAPPPLLNGQDLGDIGGTRDYSN